MTEPELGSDEEWCSGSCRELMIGSPEKWERALLKLVAAMIKTKVDCEEGLRSLSSLNRLVCKFLSSTRSPFL